MTFIEKLRKRWEKAKSMVCVGLDSDKTQVPESAGGIIPFNKSIISMTRDFVCAYKPNIAFYEGQWIEGLQALQGTFDYSKWVAPNVPIILDAKRADIGNAAKGYAKMAFDELKAGAITVNPYFGGEALRPFLDRADKGVIVLCRTSNPGAKDFQDAIVSLMPLSKKEKTFLDKFTEKELNEFSFWWNKTRSMHLYQRVALRAAAEWNKNGNVLLEVGATYPEGLKAVRKLVGDMPILVTGIGAYQGGDLEAAVKAGLDSTGFGMIINSSRGIIFASKGPDFAEVAGQKAQELRDEINAIKAQIIALRGPSSGGD